MNNQQWKRIFTAVFGIMTSTGQYTQKITHRKHDILNLDISRRYIPKFKKTRGQNCKKNNTFPISKFSQREKQRSQSLLLFFKSSFQQSRLAFPMKNVNSESGTELYLQLCLSWKIKNRRYSLSFKMQNGKSWASQWINSVSHWNTDLSHAALLLGCQRWSWGQRRRIGALACSPSLILTRHL